ncbi:hypothetical protein FOZ63_007803, partial [Perkinsus olseni]
LYSGSPRYTGYYAQEDMGDGAAEPDLIGASKSRMQILEETADSGAHAHQWSQQKPQPDVGGALSLLSAARYPLAILDECKPEIFVLDDFRVYQQQAGFAISDCLCFLEGKTPFVVPLPKTSNRADVLYYDDAPEENRMLNERFAWITLINAIKFPTTRMPSDSCVRKEMRLSS